MSSESSECVGELETESHHIGFSGLQYRLNGLSKKQGESIQKRYDLRSSGVASEPIVVDIEYQAFNSKPPAVYTGINGYEPLLEFHPDRVEVEGLDFRGTIQLQPRLAGTLLYNDPLKLESSTACENFLRMITAYALIGSGGLFMHSAAVVVEGKAYMFVGRSNAGKTTISRLALAAGAAVLSDDANVIQKSSDETYLVGSVPFAGELVQQSSSDGKAYPLAGIFVLEKSDHNTVLPLSSSHKVASLLVSSPVVNMDSYRNKILLDNLEALASQVPVAKLKFTKTQGFEEIFRCITNPIREAA